MSSFVMFASAPEFIRPKNALLVISHILRFISLSDNFAISGGLSSIFDISNGVRQSLVVVLSQLNEISSVWLKDDPSIVVLISSYKDLIFNS